MKLSQFKFKLPEDRIALYPPFRDFDGERIYNRDECKMMVVHRTTGEIEHRTFKDILEYFDDWVVVKSSNMIDISDIIVHKKQNVESEDRVETIDW